MASRPNTQGFDLGNAQASLVSTVRRKFKWAALTFWLVGILFAAALLYWPKSYRSEGKLFIRPTVKPVAEDPTATQDYKMGVASEAQEFEVNSVVDILHSRRLAEAIVDEIGPLVILHKVEAANPDSPSTPPAEGEDTAAELAPSLMRESAVRTLMGSLKIKSPKRSTVIDISCDTWSPELAQRIVSLLMDFYLQEHVRVNRVDGSYVFFQEQVQLLEEELGDVTEQLRATKNDNGLASIEGKRASFEQQLTATELQITYNQRQKSASEATIRSLNETIDSLPAEVVTQDVGGLPNNATDTMRAELFRQEARLFDLSAKYTDEHPEVCAVNEQVHKLREILDEQTTERSQTTTARSPERQTLVVTMLAEQAALKAAEARLDKLDGQRELLLAELRNLNAAEVRITELERRMQLADANYRSYAKKLEQARMHNALESDRISNIKVVQPATLVHKAVSPNKLLLVIVGLFVATMCGIAVAVVTNRFDSTLRTREDIEQQLDLPVLAAIPRSKHPELSLN